MLRCVLHHHHHIHVAHLFAALFLHCCSRLYHSMLCIVRIVHIYIYVYTHVYYVERKSTYTYVQQHYAVGGICQPRNIANTVDVMVRNARTELNIWVKGLVYK